MNTPTLETDRLILRPFKESDGRDVFECWESDPDVAKYMFWTSHNDVNKSMKWAKQESKNVSKDDWYRFALVEKSSGNLIGTGLIYYEEEVANWEIAYNLGKSHWGKGYTTEAMIKILEFAKERLKIKIIVGRHAKDNPRSENVMKKLGFIYVKDIAYECNGGTVMREGKLHTINFVKNFAMILCTSEDGAFLTGRIKELNKSLVKPLRGEDILYINRKIIDEQGKIIAGILGSVYLWDCMYIDLLWVEEKYRKQGIGTQLLSEIETEAKSKNIRMIHLDTFDYQAKGFYEKNGYIVYGILDDYPEGHSLYHMKKRI